MFTFQTFKLNGEVRVFPFVGYRLHEPLAGVGSVSRKNVYMLRVKALWAMVAASLGCWRYIKPTILALEGWVFMLKTFLVHGSLVYPFFDF